jgi:hypothetical protein
LVALPEVPESAPRAPLPLDPVPGDPGGGATCTIMLSEAVPALMSPTVNVTV